jgi:hypothetical protein
MPAHWPLHPLIHRSPLTGPTDAPQGCFELYDTLSNPWGQDMNDFPEEEFEAAIRSECVALTSARTSPACEASRAAQVAE